ncbi:MAG: COG1361 family protein [Candidatus Dormibacteria bacterium]
MTSCGSSSIPSTLTIASEVISPTGNSGPSEPVAQGTTAQVQVTVTNTGTAAFRGVTLRLVVPASLVYLSTASLVQNGDSVRAADIAPSSRDATLTWGSWTIGPGLPGLPSQVVITANLKATGASGAVHLLPEVFATGYASTVSGAPLTLNITPAPSLSLSLHVNPAAVTSGSMVTYNAVITNTGSGSAPGATLAITLPSDFDYVTTESTSGNASTSGATYPVVGSVVPTWSGFDVPGQSGSSPGLLTLTFEVKVLPDVGRGAYSASAGLIAGNGSASQNDILLNYGSLAPVTVTGP